MALAAVQTKKENWQLQEAKAMFSEVVKASILKPQIITVHGKETAVLISFGDYQKLACPQQTLFQFLQTSPLRNLDIELPQRQPEEMREVLL